jgi:hypothetical protein
LQTFGWGSAGLLGAAFAVVLLGRGVQSQPPAVGASGPGTSEEPPAAGASGADPSTAATAAQRFLSTLSDTRQAATAFFFGDPERINWAYVPWARAGIPLRATNAEPEMWSWPTNSSRVRGRMRSASGAVTARGIERILGVLLGIVTANDLLDVAEEEATENFHIRRILAVARSQPWVMEPPRNSSSDSSRPSASSFSL